MKNTSLHTTGCHNLRSVTLLDSSSALTPVTPPATVAGDSQARPLGGAPDGRLLISADDPEPSILSFLDPATGQTEDLCSLDHPVDCAVALDNIITAMTDQGPLTLSRGADDKWRKCDPSRWPALSLLPLTGADCTSTVAERTLSGSYNHVGQPLRDADRRDITADLRRAYTDVAAQARAMGAFCSPAIVRYRLIGHDEQPLFTSPPLLLGAVGIADASEPVCVTSADRHTLDSYDIAARAWRLRLYCADKIPQEMAGAVKRIEILAAPQFHPYDPHDDASIHLIWLSGDNTMLRLSVPGASRAVGSSNSRVAEASVRQMVAAMPEVEKVIAVINEPFTSGTSLDITPSLSLGFSSLDDECKALRRALSLEHNKIDPQLAAIQAPHSFSARTWAMASGVIMWGHLMPHRFSGYSPSAFAADIGSEPWHAAISVRFASGDEQIVSVAEGLSGAPLLINPLLSYPSPDAVAMTITVFSAGHVRHAVFPLIPDPSGRHAVYVHPSFAPFALTDEISAFVIPPERRVARRMPGYVALACARAPASCLAVASVGPSPVKSIFAASRSQSSWDFSKVRFSALSDDGVFTVTAAPESSSRRLSVNLIDSRPCSTAVEARGRLLAVLAGDLAEVGVARCKTLLSLGRSDLVFSAYSPAFNELWLSTGAGGSTVVSLGSLDVSTRDDCLDGPSVGPYATIAGSLCCLDRETAVASVYARWTSQLVLADRPVVVRSLTVDLRSPQISNGFIALRRLHLADAQPSPAMRLSLNGRFGSPLSVPVVTAPARVIAVDIQGRFHPSTLISSVSASYDSHRN